MQSRALVAFAVVFTVSLGSVVVALSLAASSSSSSAMDWRTSEILLLVGCSLLLSTIATYVLFQRTNRPIGQLRNALQSALLGNYKSSAAQQLGSSDAELLALAQDFDRMTARVQGHLSARSRLLRNMSDELRAPLSRLQAITSLMQQRPGQDEALAERMERELQSLHRLIAEVLTYAQLETKSSLKRQPTNLTDMVRTIAEDAAATGAEKNVTVSLSKGEDVLLNIEHGLIYAAVENLAHHALQRASEGGSISLAVSCAPGEALLSIHHDGQPILDAATLDHLFEPFGATQGTGGMGLAVARRAILLHGGNIEATNSGDGLLVAIKLPSEKS